MLFLAEHNLSFHGHSCKNSDPDNGFSWSIFECFRVAPLQQITSSSFTKKYWLFFIHFHHRMPLKFNLRAPILQNFLGGMPLDPPSISMLRMLIVVLCTINSTSKGPTLFYAPGPLIPLGAPINASSITVLYHSVIVCCLYS